MFFPNRFNPHAAGAAADDVEAGRGAPGPDAPQAQPSAHGQQDTYAPQEAGASQGAGPLAERRLLTSKLSRDVVIGTAAGLGFGAFVAGAYGLAKDLSRFDDASNCVQHNSSSTPYTACASGVGPSASVVGGLMAGLPIAGCVIAAGVHVGRYLVGHDNAETRGPVPEEKKPFWTRQLGYRAAAAAGVGLVVGVVASLATAGMYYDHRNNVHAGCIIDFAQGNLDARGCDLGSGGVMDKYAGSFPAAGVACAMLFLPVGVALLEVGRNALAHDFRKARS